MVVAETALAITMVSPHETTTEPSASFAILPVSIEIELAPICAVTLCCIFTFLDVRESRPVTLIVGVNSDPAVAGRPCNLKPNVPYRPGPAVFVLVRLGCGNCDYFTR